MRLLVLLLLLPAAAAAAPSAPALPAGAEARIEAAVETYRAREKVPGVAILAMRGDEVLFSRAFGTGAGVRTRQPYYSIGKQMTAALVLGLAAEGRIDLDAPVGLYLPEWFADEPRLRVRHLLRHISGLADFIRLPEVLAIEQAPGSGSLAAMAPIIDRLPRRYGPGERHSYSNSNYTLLALIAERAAGRPFGGLLRERLFAPLGLASMESCAALASSALIRGHDSNGATVALPPNPGPSFDGNGGVCGDASDLARWTRALGAGRVVGARWLRGMRRGEGVAAGYTPPYGFGLSTVPVAGRRAFSHAGGGDGWGAWAAYLPEEELTVVLLADRGWLWSTDMGVPVVRALLGDSEPSPPARHPLTRKERAALSGRFEDGLFDIDIAAESDRILVTVPPFGPPIELWKQGDGSFVSPRRPDTFRLRRAGGRIEFDWMEHRSYLVRRTERGPVAAVTSRASSPPSPSPSCRPCGARSSRSG